MDELCKAIILKPTANGSIRSERTVLNYASNMRLLYKRMEDKPWDYDVVYFKNNAKRVCEYLSNTYKMGTAQNYLSSIIISLQANELEVPEEYSNLMLSNGEILRSEQNKQAKTASENVNWTTVSALQKHLKTKKKALDLRSVFRKDFKDLTYFEKNLLRDWVVGNLYIGDENNPPLRADYCMKITTVKDYKNVDKNENYLVIQGRNKKFFHLGKYKTSSHYGEKIIPVGSKLNKVLNLYLQVHKETDFLIYTNRGVAVTPDTLAKLVPQAFKELDFKGKHITINLLRHIYISEFLPEGGPTLSDKKEIAGKMLHSVVLQEKYKKME